MKKTLAATAIAATTLGGVAAGAALFVPGSAGAQEGVDDVGETAGQEFGAHIAEALQPLVDDGTLTEDQVDAVSGALEAARPEGFGHRGGHGQRGPAGGGEIAEILGLEAQELGEALRGGQSLADVAAEQGVDTQDLIDAIVDNAEERAAAAVEAGRIDQDKADEIIAGAADHAEDMISGEFEFGRRGPGRGGSGFGPGADGGPDTDTAA